ncbi:MAG: hydrolase [Clostridiales Family XIII bacterium]|jgi:predicted hydrolase (HD superfamily)|nr:hydrolase [Clostridiales Family XIII bacterium]
MAYETHLTREAALALLEKHNRDAFHIRHALIVEGVMRHFARALGYADEEEFWGLVGLLHDIDFEEYPERHCLEAPALLRAGGAEEELIHAVVSHGWAITVDVAPEHEMEKVLYATDELTGLIGAVAIMRPSRSVQDLEYPSVRKKYKDRKFAAGCSRDVIERGAELLGWDLETLVTRTIEAMREVEPTLD